MATSRVKVFSLSRCVQAVLKQAEYGRDEDGVVVAEVPGGMGFVAQGDSYEEARVNLEEAVEGNVLLALQLGWDVPPVAGVDIEEQNVETDAS